MIDTKISLFDTKSRQLQSLVCSDGKTIRVYSCGPTVYRDAHVGNLRTFLLGDLITRLAKYLGFEVSFIQNITDVGHMSEDFVEDKMLAQAKAESKDPFEIARIYEGRFHNVSIQTVDQNGRNEDAELIIVTHRATEGELKATVEALKKMDIVNKISSVIRVEGALS